MLGNPWIAMALAASIATASFGAAWSWRAALCEAAAAAKVEESQQRKDNEAAQAHGASAGLEADNAEANGTDSATRRELAQVVRRPVYARDCADADGLRLLRAAFTGESAGPGEPHLPLPRPEAP